MSQSTKNLFVRSLVAVLLIWAFLFLFLRNPVWREDKITTGNLTVQSENLKEHVYFLSQLSPPRSYLNPQSLQKSQDYIVEKLKSYGYAPELEAVVTNDKTYYNIIVRYGEPRGQDLVVVGAHYDTEGTLNPGADDNASGVAGLLELARLFQQEKPSFDAPIELVAYVNEEPPFYDTPQMGSYVHARNLKNKDINVKLMLSLEMIGYFSSELFSQRFSIPILYGIYPWRGNFIGIVGNTANRDLQRNLKTAMKAGSALDVYSISAPIWGHGVDYSDHRSYWQHDWPAFMITDTAFLRNFEYHKEGDTPERLDYQKMAEVVRGVFTALEHVN